MSRPDASPATLTILVVDDEFGVREVMTMFLEEEGYRVMQARDGVEALAAVAAADIDLILSDVSMPRLDGLALASHVRSIARDLPIVLMSGQATAVDLPGIDVLPKPIVPARLFAAIASALAARGTTNRAPCRDSTANTAC